VQALTNLLRTAEIERMVPMEDSGFSIQEIILHKWEYEWDDELKAHIPRITDEMGCTWWDVVMDCQDLFLKKPDYVWDIKD
jgi:hypothetical protein